MKSARWIADGVIKRTTKLTPIMTSLTKNLKWKTKI